MSDSHSRATPVVSPRTAAAFSVSLALSLAAALGTGATAQQTLPGYSANTAVFPPSSSSALRVPGGTVYFDGFELVFDQGTGSPTSLLNTGPVFPSFLIPLDPGRVIFGESSAGNIYVLSLTGPNTGAPLVNLPFNYDAEVIDPNTIAVSAKVGGFGTPDTDLVVVDLGSGVATYIGVIPGASGPLLVTPAGGLLYATGTLLFPPPPGATELLHWTPAQMADALAGTVPLSYGNGRVVVAGLEGFSDMVLDSDGDLIFSDYNLARLGEIDDVLGPRPVVRTLVDYSAGVARPGALQFVRGMPGIADFEPFQAAEGGTLIVAESDFISLYQLTDVSPRRAQLGVVGAGPNPVVSPGPFALEIVDAAPGGTGFLVLSLIPAWPNEVRVAVPGLEQVISWNPASAAPLASLFVTLDGTGAGQWQTVNPGLGGVGLTVQAAFADGAVTTIGSTNADSLILQ